MTATRAHEAILMAIAVIVAVGWRRLLDLVRAR